MGQWQNQTTNRPRFSAPTAPLSFHNTSKLFRNLTIFSWLTSLLRRLPVKQCSWWKHTFNNKTRVGYHFTEYCKSIGLGNNLFLEGMSSTHKINLESFAMAVHQEKFLFLNFWTRNTFLKLQWTRLEKYKSGFSFFLCFLGHVIWHRSEIIY